MTAHDGQGRRLPAHTMRLDSVRKALDAQKTDV